MKILDRYILREISGYALLALLVFTFVLTIPEVLRMSELFARHSISFGVLLRLCLLVLPGKLVWTIPMAVLVGLLVAWSRLAADSELEALQATGLGFARLLWPAALFAAVSFLLALATSLWGVPASARAFRALQVELASEEIPSEIQARVFDERFPNLVLYVQDAESGGARWKGVLLAETDRPDAAKLTLAESGIVVNEAGRRRMQLHLGNGSVHEHRPEQPERYSVSTFAENVLSLALAETPVTPVELRRNAERSLGELWRASQTAERWRSLRIDFHRRLALPTTCLVFGLLAVPLALAGSRGGRTAGVVVALLLLLAYYAVFVFTDRLAREGLLIPWLGAWAANIGFAILGLVLLVRARRPPRGNSWWHGLPELVRWRRPISAAGDAQLPASIRGAARERSGLPRLLDLYILRGLVFQFVLFLASFLALFGLFNLLDLVDDIAEQQVGWRVVGEYLWYLLPQAVYWMVPLAALLAVLVELGLLSKRNELVAVKAAGISLFRLAVPVLLLGLVFSLGVFLLDFYYLPYTNQRQEALRNQIKGRPPQTVYQPQRKWIFGQQHRIFHYRFFDSQQNIFAELSMFELAPDRFSLMRRLYARRAHWEASLEAWVFEDGWERRFDDDRASSFRTFTVATFPELTERPDHFKKEVVESSQMNFLDLRRYITELRQAGFDVGRLQVEWHHKFAFPLTCFLMMLLGFPFGLRVGRRGALGGVASGIALGLTYWVVSAVFAAFGNMQLLPPLLAGWGADLLFAFSGAYWLLHIRT